MLVCGLVALCCRLSERRSSKAGCWVRHARGLLLGCGLHHYPRRKAMRCCPRLKVERVVVAGSTKVMRGEELRPDE